MFKIEKTTTKMHGVQAAVYERFMGYDCCISNDRYFHFTRTEWRWRGILLWRKDSPREDRPLYELIHRALGTG